MPDSTTIFAFGEGPTDKVVFNFLIENFFSSNKNQIQPFVVVGGKGNFKSEERGIPAHVSSEIEAKRQNVSILVFRDRDDGEQIPSICQSFGYIVHNVFSSWNISPQMQTVSQGIIYKWEVPPAMPERPGFRFVLHIADNGRLYLPVTLRNHTTDGYVLASGLLDPVMDRFAGEINATRQTISELITQSIPALIRNKGIVFNEDKDFLASYLVATRFWAVKRTEEEARLVKIILERAVKYAPDCIGQVFGSWMRAIQEVV